MRALDDIQPRPVLPKLTSAASTQTAPLDALRLYAKARAAQLDDDRAKAIEYLEEAIRLDPQSYELHVALGKAYGDDAAMQDKALAQLEAAAAIEPDHLDLQAMLGRHYLQQGKLDQAIVHLRLALQTSDYNNAGPASSAADLLLARALRKRGYDRAALDMYERLLTHFHASPFSIRPNSELAALLGSPASFVAEIAELYEKHHQYDAALRLLEPAEAHQPRDVELHARIVRDLLASGRGDDARRRASALLEQGATNPEALAVFAQAYEGHDADAMRELLRLRRARPNDRRMLLTLIDFLRSRGRTADASQLLDEASRQSPDDLALMRRHVSMLRQAGNFAAAARVLIDALASHPDAADELEPLWDSLTRPSAFGRLRLADVQGLFVPPNEEPARLLWLGRSAHQVHRTSVERQALQRAVQFRPVFAPAWRDLVALIGSETGGDEKQKAAAAAKLSADAEAENEPALAAELRGLALSQQGHPREAALALAQAAKRNERSPQLYVEFATSLHLAGDDAAFERLMWKVISDRPTYRDAYLELYGYYSARSQDVPAQKVLMAWLAADPDSTTARRLEAGEYYRSDRPDACDRILLELFREDDSDPEVLAALRQFYAQTKRAGQFVQLLRDRLAREPRNFALAAALAEAYTDGNRPDDAARVLDQARVVAAQDPDLLYELSSLYERIGRKDASESVLREVLRLEPSYAGAGNDLGYTWAEQGKNLEQAEALVRGALKSDPDNPSFLDSMGWVLYKRGRFAEALTELRRAVAPDPKPDPVVLDHLGDTLYRLGDHAAAAANWRRATERLKEVDGPEREGLDQLHRQLDAKIQQADAGREVDVAPVAERPPATREAQR